MASTTPVVDLYEETTTRRIIKKQPGTDRLVRAQPKSAEDLAKILTNPKDFPSPVRPVGSDSSVTRCNQSATGTLLDLTRLDRIVSLKEDFVTVQAGVRLRDLAEYLAADGLELFGGCIDTNRTVGGAISSGTLGARLPGDGAQLASSVLQITLVNGNGRRVEVNQRLPDLLGLIRMSYGLLGVIYAATLRVRPIQHYSISNSKVDFAEFVDLIPNLMEAQAAVRGSLMPFRDRVLVELRYPTNGDNTGSHALPAKLRDWATHAALPKVVRSMGKAIPGKALRGSLIDSFTEATHVFNQLADSGSNAAEQTGRFKRLVISGDTQSCTWFFPVEQFAEAVQAYRKMSLGHYRNTGYRCDLPAEIWRVNQDQSALLSPTFDAPAFALSLRSTADKGWDDYLMEFSDLAAPFRAVPAFNLTKGFKPGYASRVAHDRMKRFRDMRDRLDPRNRLLNQFFAEHIR